MLFSSRGLIIAATLISTSIALPPYGLSVENVEKRSDGFPDDLAQRLGAYQAPGPNDSRGPCPGLNTLANHGLINRNGKNINSSDIKLAFPRGFGIAENGFDLALHNFEVVCEYIKGTTCGTPANDGTFILTNLTILGEPHAFEHDHSLSRQDYRQNYAHGGITDNIYFNSSKFQDSLDVVNYKPSNPPVKKLAGYSDFNEIRLQRESQQNHTDFPGSFQQAIPPTLFEIGFIFGAVSDRDSKGNILGGANPSVRLDWWNFWFSEESFPTQLGWVPASTEVFQTNFISSVSAAVLRAPVTSTPAFLPPGALATTAPPPVNLPEADPSPTFLLFQSAPYVAPTKPASIKSEPAAKRDVAAAAATSPVVVSSVLSAIASDVTAKPQVITSAIGLIGPAPSKYDFYQQRLDITSLRNQIAQAQSYESAIISQITSILG